MNRHVRAEGWRLRRQPQANRGVCRLLLAVLMLAVLMPVVSGLAFSPAHAALETAGHSLPHGSPAVWIGLALLVLGGLCLAGATRLGRTAAILALVLLVALFGLESAVHSVHHLSDPQAAGSCAMFSASQHVAGACAETPDAGTPTWTAEPSPTVDAEGMHPLQAFRSHDGRAPPALPSV